MIEIRNLLFQPLAFHLSGDAGGIHLGSRERKSINDEELSDEIRAAATRGFVSLMQPAESTQPNPRLDAAEDEHTIEPAGDEPQVRRKRGKAR